MICYFCGDPMRALDPGQPPAFLFAWYCPRCLRAEVMLHVHAERVTLHIGLSEDAGE